MSFTELPYYILLLVSFLGYWALPAGYPRRLFLVAASFIFYSLWNWRFFSLLFISATTDYACALLLARTSSERRRKALLVCTLFVNFGLLAYFKYFNFFMDSLNAGLEGIGQQGFSFERHVILPLGISFYTFHTVSYTIDVYRRKVEPIRNYWDYFLFVCYFPQLVAGPIARVTALYPQFFAAKKLEFGRVTDAVLLICYGLLLKFLVADNLGAVVDYAYSRPTLNGALGWAAVFGFGYQIYVDFWSYTLIARASSRLFAIELNPNFEQPYLSATPSEFWRRWHMSLSSWFRDYLYIPLGGNKKHAAFNLLFTMTVAGLWHGSSWLFLLWGFYHGVLLIVFRAFPLPRALSAPLTFLLVNLGWVLFRSQDLAQAGKIFGSLTSFTAIAEADAAPVALTAACVAFAMLADVVYRWRARLMPKLPAGVDYLKWSLAGSLLMLVLYLGETSATSFIYFNF